MTKAAGSDIATGSDDAKFVTAKAIKDSVAMVLTTPRIVTSINDSNGNEVIKTPATASAVNEVTMTNAATGTSPSISATGGDTDINLKLGAKGAGGIDFQKFKAITMACDNGATLPTSPVVGQWFLHTPTGRKVLMQYEGSSWIPILNVGTTTVYVDYTDGTDAQDNGGAVNAGAYKTIQFAIDQIAGLFSGAITINLSPESHYCTTTNATIRGKNATGNFGITIQGTKSTVVANATATSGSRTSLTNTGATLATAYTVDNASTASTLKTTADAFTAAHVGKLVYNSTDTKTRRIATYVGAREVTVDSAIGDTWDGNTIYICNYADMFVRITAGTGAGQILPIQWHTHQVITLGGWADAALDNTSQYVIEQPDATITGAAVGTPTTGSYIAISIDNVGCSVSFTSLYIKYCSFGILSGSASNIILTQIGMSNCSPHLINITGATVLYTAGSFFDLRPSASNALVLTSGVSCINMRSLFRAFNGSSTDVLNAIKSSCYVFNQQCIWWGAKDVAAGANGFNSNAAYVVTYDCTLHYCNVARYMKNSTTYWGPGTVTLTGNGTDGTVDASTYSSNLV